MTSNRLGAETSPYLRQHADNPVHWWAWGPEALAEAKRTNRPILLSVGYAACHWCHVMAHESFEDAATAAVMNELFVNIKVDREERPDIDAIYMGALHKLGEQGGWPLTMFLDAGARPFWGGTYFPKESRFGRPRFVDVLRQVADIYRDDPDKVAHNAEIITGMLQPSTPPAGHRIITEASLADLVGRMTRLVDMDKGGIKGAPKFPQWTFFWLLWRGGIRYGIAEARRAVEVTLANICQGGIYDHVGGGFARYSVDEHWLVPHFEKMLYDNALLIDLLTEAWRETRNPLFEQRVAETADWLAREMIAEGGGFAASLDADSEGEEGKFYVWSLAEIRAVLGEPEAARFAAAYDITEDGNFEGHNIPNRLRSMELGTDEHEDSLPRSRAKLLAVRAKRIPPGWDDKVLADWNGLMIAALSRAAIVFGRPEWSAMCETAFAFVREQMSWGDGRLHHAARGGIAKAPATSADYANMIWAALRLHQATGRDAYLAAALEWNATLDRHYWRAEGGGYYQTADDTDDVIVRLCAAQDDAVPNANGTMIANLAQLAMITGDPTHLDRAAEIFSAFAADTERNLVGHTGLLAGGIDLHAPQMVVISGADTGGLAAALHAQALPGAQEFIGAAGTAPGLQDKAAINNEPTGYACFGPQCSAPVRSPEALRQLLLQLRAHDPAA